MGRTLFSVFVAAALLCSASASAHAGSIWQYTFADEIGLAGFGGQEIGFSFAELDPLVIPQNSYLLLNADDMSAYTVPEGDTFQYVELSWMWNGDFRVTFAYDESAAGWGVDDEMFPIASLATEGVYGDWPDATATLTIHDPPAGAPEPSSRWSAGLPLLLGTALLAFRKRSVLLPPAPHTPGNKHIDA